MVVNMLSLRGLEPTDVHRVFKEKNGSGMINTRQKAKQEKKG